MKIVPFRQLSDYDGISVDPPLKRVVQAINDLVWDFVRRTA